MTTRSRDTQPPLQRNTRHRRRHARRRRVATGFAASVLLLAAIIVFVAAWGRQNPEPASASIDSSAVEMSSDAALVSERPIYRHSVIAGGAYNPEELGSAMLQDAVVAGHYRGLVPNAVRAEIVTEDRLVYVSYRKDDRIYWTKNKVLLRQGETILTDGTNQIRARCGNCISEKPLSPVSETEPDPIEFDRLVDDRDLLNPGGPVAALGAPRAQGGAQNSLTTAAPGTSAQGPVAGPVGSNVFPVGPTAIGPSQVAQAHSIPFGPTLGDTIPNPDSGPPSVVPVPGIPAPGDPSPSPGTTPPSPGTTPPPPGTTPPPAPPTSDGPPFQAGPNPIPFPPGLIDSLPGSDSDLFGSDSDLFPDAPDTPGSPSDPDPPRFGSPPPDGGPGPDWPYHENPPLEPVNPVSVPEPGTILLVGGGAAIALFRKLRSRH